GHTLYVGLPTELALRTDFTGHPGYLGREGAELVHHRVDGVLEFQNFTAHIHRDLSRQLAIGDHGSHVRDIAHLARQVTGHRVHAICQVLPCAGHTRHVGLPTELPFRTHFAGHARHFRCKRTELIHHRVDGVLELQDFALYVDGNLS